ncbi:methyltransferase domain-containing protein [Oleomonas cavernae]|uniref:Methyltransferase domain-containing protein n=1 Tax=Oleomonas cavernae TaxID=2320859 RepID=A0A418WDE8_9PROT|nr:methyltransferase domain-containing protein [Oleomonas cavernae]RJF87969.1 methyltransferase domain-containing protein [Oleomonas cavernae]
MTPRAPAPPAPNDMLVFDRRAVARHRERAAATLGRHGFLFEEIALRLAERLDDINRQFPLILDLGAHDGALGRLVAAGGRGTGLVSTDLSQHLVARAPGLRLVADEEWLPFADQSFDLVLSAGSLHWVNDLPGTLIQIRDVLKPDGLFMASLIGGGTLIELRQAFLAAEARVEGAASLHVSPFVDLRDAAGLMQRAGFAMPVVDLETITVTYADVFALMRDLKGMGEANALAARRRKPLRRETLLALAEEYQARFALADGRIPATFEIVTLTGWAPGPDQPVPKRPGSAKSRLADALGTVEVGTGEKPGR